MTQHINEALARAEQSAKEREALIAECHQLIDQIAQRPQYLKLLEGAAIHLRLLASSKRR